MEIILSDTGKKFNTEWIFRKVNFTFHDKTACAILGRNGSGKSTLLQVIAGNLHPTAGTVRYFYQNEEIHVDKIFRQLVLVAPYQELIEDFTLKEMLYFHFGFKRLLPGFTLDKAVDMIGFKTAPSKQIRQFSSGMKQRVKLILAFLSDVPLVLLDEPSMNLDRAGTDWYLNLVEEFTKNRSVIVCSNLEQQETAFCQEKIFIEDYKL